MYVTYDEINALEQIYSQQYDRYDQTQGFKHQHWDLSNNRQRWVCLNMICDTHTQVITGYHRLPLDPAVNPSFSRSTPLLSAEFLWISSPKSDYGVSVASGSKHIHSPTHLHISRIKVAQFLPLRTGIQVLLVCSSESHQGLGNSVDYGHLNGTWEKHRNGF